MNNLANKIKDNTGVLICVVLILALIVWGISDGVKEARPKPIESEAIYFKWNEHLDSVITKRTEKIDSVKLWIEASKAQDAVTVREKTKVYNNYYYENNRINNLSDSGQFGLLSKNLTKAAERERNGYYDVPNR